MHLDLRRLRCWISAVVFALGLIASVRPAAAQEGRAAQLLRAYAQANNFKVREIPTGPSYRRVTRLCAPVTPETLGAFCKAFSADNKAAHICYDGGTHLALGVNGPGADGKPSDAYLWATNYNGQTRIWSGGMQSDYRGMYMRHTPTTGRMIGIDLSGDGSGGPLAYLQGWLEKVRTTGVALNPINQDNMVQGGCMKWLSNAEVAPGVPIAHHVGVKRSVNGDGPNFRAKLCHVANNRVVLGVCVANPAEFDAMSDQNMLGNQPAAGLDDSGRR